MVDNKYLRSSIEGMNNNELIELLYQETIKNIKKAEFSIEKNNVQDKVNHINKAIEIITALTSVINDEKGGEISQRLRALYNYSTRQLTLANMENNISHLTPVSNIFRELLSAWSEMMKGATQGVTPEPQSVGTKGLEIYG